MSGFPNPVLGGGGALIRNSAHSPNYAAATTGWSINQDGSAEFNSVTARGTVEVDGPSGNYVRIYNDPTNGAVISMQPATTPATVSPAQTITQWIDTGNGPQPHVTMSAPFYNGNTNCSLDLAGTNADGSSGNRAALTADQIFLTGNNSVTVNSLTVFPNAVNANGDLVVTGNLRAPNCAGSVPVSFTSLTSFTVNVTFPEPFATPPVVMTNIASGSGVVSHWSSRAIGVSTTGFQLFVFSENGAAAQTWSNVPVQWLAVGT